MPNAIDTLNSTYIKQHSITNYTILRILVLRVLALTTINLCRNEQQGGAT